MNHEDANGIENHLGQDRRPKSSPGVDETRCFFEVKGVCCNSRSFRRNEHVDDEVCDRCDVRKPLPRRKVDPR